MTPEKVALKNHDQSGRLRVAEYTQRTSSTSKT